MRERVVVVVVVHWRLTAAPSPQPKPPPDPPASLQRGIITEIDNVKNSFQKHFLNTRPHLVPRVKHEILSTSGAVGGLRRFSNSFQFRIVPLRLHLKLLSSKWEYEILCFKGAEGLYESKLGNLYFPFSRRDLVRRGQITWSGKQTRYLSTNN